MIYLGIDCGTQSLKVLIWDPDGKETRSVSRPYGLIEDLPPGHKEQHPGLWIEALESCMAELREDGAPMDQVAGIGVSGQQHGLVVLDSEDRVIRPAKLWNDTSTENQCRAIVESAGGLEPYREETGNSLPPGFTASKLLWIKENEFESYQRIRTLFLPHDYLNFYLTGEKVAEAGDASGTGYFKVRERVWSEKALFWIDSERDLGDCLPRLIESYSPAGSLRPALARRWGVSSNAIVSSGGGDNMMGAIGTGNVSSGLMTVSLGTSGTIYSYNSSPVIDPEGEIAGFCDSTGGWLPLGCTMNVTVATEMIRNGFLKADHSGLSKAIEGVPPGAEGMLLVPYLEGERMPAVSDGTGVLLGLRPQSASPAHLARAAMEGVTFGLRYGLDKLKMLGTQPSEIRLTGGGAKSRIWRSIAADIFGVPVVCPSNEEGPALGAAIQALWCTSGDEIGKLTQENVHLQEETRTAPDSERSARYEEIYALYDETSKTLIQSEVFPRHRRLIEK